MKLSLAALVDLACLVGGAVLLSLAFGWRVGAGVALLVYFHKPLAS